MEEFNRKFFKEDPVLNVLYSHIKSNHKVARHTERVLSDNKHIKDFCEEARHFVEMPGSKSLYIHYDVSSWYQNGSAIVRIDNIGVYEDFLEYDIARLKQLHSTKQSDIPNIN